MIPETEENESLANRILFIWILIWILIAMSCNLTSVEQLPELENDMKYYRLTNVDFDGERQQHGVISGRVSTDPDDPTVPIDLVYFRTKELDSGTLIEWYSINVGNSWYQMLESSYEGIIWDSIYSVESQKEGAGMYFSYLDR